MSDVLKQEDLDALFGALESGDIVFPDKDEDPGGEEDANVDQDALADEWEKQLEQEYEAKAAPSAARPAGSLPRELDVLLGIELKVHVVVGKTNMFINDILQLSQGSLIELDQKIGSLLSVEIEGKKVAAGEPVITNEKFGVRLKQVLSVEDRIKCL